MERQQVNAPFAMAIDAPVYRLRIVALVNLGLGDLAALNREIQDALTAQPPVVTALIAASFRSEKAEQAQTRLWQDRYDRGEADTPTSCAGRWLP